MSKNLFKNRLVAVLNKKIEPGRLMNALAHMCIGLGSAIKKDELLLTNYQDASGQSHPYISEIPFMILSENSNKIRKLRYEALNYGILINDFTETMTKGTFQEQLEQTRQVKEEELTYFGIAMFGDWDKVTELTKKFSLWK